MSDYITNATVNLQMNGKEPKQVLEELKQRAFDLQNAIAKAASEGKKADLSKLKKELKTTQRQIKEMESATEQVAEVMKRLDKASPKELQKTLRALEKQLNSIERGSKEWEQQCQRIKAVRAEIDRVNKELREGETLLQRINRKWNDWQTVVAGAVATVTGLVLAGRSAVNAYAEMDAEMASVKKYTGMTADEVEKLNEEFKKMDTRTSREGLNQLAQEAGRLGKQSVEDVLGFVRAADQINVALDDLGDGATLTLSKLTSIFGDEERLGTERSLLAVGSVINELSQNCTASAPYLAQFAQRLAGVGAQAGMTIPQIMGFAAVLDSQGQAVEMSATAMSKLVMNLFKDTEKIARATGLNLEEFNAALKRSTNEGLLMLLERMKELGGMDVLAPVFSDMGEEGARASAVLAALAGNIDMVRRQQEVATTAFEEATSVTTEFNVQNTTVQAGLDKARKRVKEMAVELGEKLKPVMSHIISSTTLILRLLSAVVDFVVKHRTAIISLTSAIIAYKVAINATNIALKAKHYWMVLTNGVMKLATSIQATYRTAVLLATVAVNKLTGNTQRAAAAQRMLNTAQKANLYALLISLVVGVATALVSYYKSLNKVSLAEQTLADIRAEAQKKMVDEKMKIESLIRVAEDESIAMERRLKAVNKLNEIIPNYNANIDATTGKYNASTTALNEYTKALMRRYEVEGAKEKLSSLGREKVQLLLDKRAAEEELARAERIASSGSYVGGREGAIMRAGEGMNIVMKQSKVNDIQSQIAEIEETERYLIGQYGKEIDGSILDDPGVVNDNNGGTVVTGGVGGMTEDKFAAEKEWREREEALNRIAYAKGKKNYEEYTLRMQEIAIEYHKKQLEHTDLSALERLSIEADYYEAIKKQQEQQNNFAEEKSKEAIGTAKAQEEDRYNSLLAIEKQRYIDGEISLQQYQNTVELAELEHLRNMTQVFNVGSEEYIRANARYQDRLIADQKKRQQAVEEAEKQHLAELARLKQEYFGNSKAENEALLEKDLANLRLVYDAEILAAGDNAAEKLRIDEAYEKAKLALRKKYGLLADEEQKNFILQGAEWLKGDGGQAITESFDTLVSGMSSIFSGLSSLIEAELELQTSAIESRYDKEISYAEGNTYKVKKLEEQKQKEIAKLKNEANKKMFAMQVIQAVAQTAQNALSAFGSAAAVPIVGYILAPIAAAMAIAAGAIQIASIKKQQQASEAQGYMQGGFTKPGKPDEVAGVVHAGEWVASQKLLASPVARPMIEALDKAQRTNTISSLRADDVSRSITAPMVATRQQGDVRVIVERSEQEQKPDTELSSTIRKLNERLDEPFVTINTVTGDYGIKQAQDEYDKLIRNKTPKSRR